MKNLFQIMTIILTITFVDQLYMINEYANISIETIFITFCLLLASIKFGFFEDTKSVKKYN